MKRVAFIGLGRQNSKDHLAAALKNSDVLIVAVCDNDEMAARKCAEELGLSKYYTSVDEMAQSENLDAAIVAVPHFAYLPIVTILAEQNISIFKEKPLAMTLDEAESMANLAEKYQMNLTVAVQRKYNKVYKSYFQYVERIGDIFSIHGEYTLNIPRLDEGWRSSKRLSGGGAVIDMGYHLVDLIVWYFGLPATVAADFGYHNRSGQAYDVEDTAKIQFTYPAGERAILGSLLLSRIYPQKDESLSIYGTKGSIKIFKNKIELYDENKELAESVYVKNDDRDIKEQFDVFIESLDNPACKGNYMDHLQDMIFIDSIYRSSEQGETIKPGNDIRYKALAHREKKEKVAV